MAEDFRVWTSFRTSPKRARLHAVLGADGVLALLDLWSFATENYPRGVFRDSRGQTLTAAEIQDAIGWRQGTNLVATLLEIGWLDRIEGEAFALHGWEERNHWVFNAEHRSRVARQNIAKRWSRDDKANTIRTTDGNTPLLSSPLHREEGEKPALRGGGLSPPSEAEGHSAPSDTGGTTDGRKPRRTSGNTARSTDGIQAVSTSPADPPVPRCSCGKPATINSTRSDGSPLPLCTSCLNASRGITTTTRPAPTPPSPPPDPSGF